MKIHDYQVLQRDADDKAHVTLDSGETIELPVGGPYEVGGAKNVLVGDLWVLGGQSNMEGYGDLVDLEPPSLFVHSYQSREEWAVAEEPLHWLGESPRLVHHTVMDGPGAVPDEMPPRDPNRLKGTGLGLTFAKARHAQTGVPIGLIPCAHGGTSMQQWSPELRDQGGASLYGAMFERVKANGGKIAGVLWYQGESDCNPTDTRLYEGRMTALVHAFRADFGQPGLPFYLVQLGGVVVDADPVGIESWNVIREIQRSWAHSDKNIGMASAVDLELDDLIHIGARDFKRLGKRLADVANGYPAPDLREVTRESDGFSLRVTYDNVRGGLRAAGRPAGFSLRHEDGTELMRIYKTTLEGNAAILHLTDNALPPGTQLWYGWGLFPYCNVTDAEDAAVPAFGPVSLPPHPPIIIRTGG